MRVRANGCIIPQLPTMKIICAPDKFKGTLTAAEAAAAMARGIARADRAIEIDICPIGDGGEGTLDALVAAMNATIHAATVCGPLGEPVKARYGMTADGMVAIIELAQASGLTLVPVDRRDPTKSTSFGTGELMRSAIIAGCRTIIVCLGGSATIDGGTGIAQALGAKFWDEAGRLIEPPEMMTGGMLKRIARFVRPVLPGLQIRVACDVTNPLCGPNGAAAVYGPQKGATAQQVRELDEGLAHLAKIVGGDASMPGTGAAGGAGFGLMAMCGGQLHRGIDLVLDAVGFYERCRGADLVLTGEGQLDRQSLHGKACMGVATAAAKHGVPTIAIVGSTGEGAEDCTDPKKGGLLKRYVSLTDRFSLHRALHEPAALVEQVACEIAARAS